MTVGRYPVLDAEQARRRAAFIIARIKAGEEPVPLPLPAKHAGGPTVTDLARRYLEEHVAVRCKPKTQRTARSVVNRHIVPALGKLPIAAVERRHVMALHESLCETPAMSCIDDIVRKRGITETEAARLLGQSQLDMSRLLRGDFREQSLLSLLRLLTALGCDIDIVIRQPQSASGGKLRIVAAEQA